MQENQNTQEKITFLKQVSVFDIVNTEDLEKIAAALQVKHVTTGETVFKKNEEGDTLYIIAEGKVRVHDDGHVIGRLGNGEVFGEFSLFDNEKRSASVTAEENTKLYTLYQDDFYRLMATNSSVIHGVMQVLIKRLRYMNELENKLSKSYLKISKQKEEIQKRNENIRQQKKELEEKNKQLEQSNSEKNRLIQVIAHDLKNPLASSICVADMLAGKEAELTKEQDDSVEVLQSSLKNMNNIINQILDVYELKTKNLNLRLDLVNLALEVKNTLENFAYVSSKKELNIDFRQKNTFALVDKNLITLVLENILYNEIRFSKDFGNIIIDFEETDDKAKIIIEDDAPADKALQYKKLFGFYQKPTPDQLNTFPSAEESVVVKYVEAMDGKVRLPKADERKSRIILIFNKPLQEKKS